MNFERGVDRRGALASLVRGDVGRTKSSDEHHGREKGRGEIWG